MDPAVYDTDSFRFFYMSNCGGSLRTTPSEVLMSRGLYFFSIINNYTIIYLCLLKKHIPNLQIKILYINMKIALLPNKN